jgi:methionyl aminopeptidase
MMEKEIIEKYEKAGKVAKEVSDWSKHLVKEGASTLEIAEKIEAKIVELGAKPACPVNIGINSIAAHHTPKFDEKTVLQKGDLVKIDFSVHVDGYIADTAYSEEIGTHQWENLIKASKEALDAALKVIKPGVTVSEVGAAIEKEIKKYGYIPITDLSGHTLEEYTLHGGMRIPNYDNDSNQVIEEGTVIAIEPFATNGNGGVLDLSEVEIFSIEEPRPVRMPVARKILEIADREYQTLPFCKRWIIKKIGAFGIETGLRELIKVGALHSYPVLKETGSGMVSQHEHTVIVLDKPIVTTI